MIIPDDLATWLKIIGALSSASGSILLAFRIKMIVKWLVFAIVAHEESLDQVEKILNSQPQTGPMIKGVTTHLLDVESKMGLFLLISGFGLLAIGMLCTAASYFFAVPSAGV